MSETARQATAGPFRYAQVKATKRYASCVPNCIVTSHHIHLLVVDNGNGEIVRSMQLIAG